MVHSNKTLKIGFTNSFCNINGLVQKIEQNLGKKKKFVKNVGEQLQVLVVTFQRCGTFKLKKHRVSPQILAREREKNIRRYRAEFREGIKALLQYVAIHGDQEREKPIEQAQIGVQLSWLFITSKEKVEVLKEKKVVKKVSSNL